MDKRRGATAVLDLVALVILVAETVLVGFVAVGYCIYALLDGENRQMSAALGAVMAIFAVGVGAFTWGFAKRRRFALSGALAWQLMQASVGVWLLTVWPLVGVVLIVLAVVVTVSVVRRLADYGRSGEIAAS
ncbi:hypothetical protein [Demequina sp.]|uniref:hypothetical protein n=1 Tax=Demequina sp. TaxID=2050685 RepID=UPI0025C10E6E|nr:hypothetical protein [Demequina sp.]